MPGRLRCSCMAQRRNEEHQREQAQRLGELAGFTVELLGARDGKTGEPLRIIPGKNGEPPTIVDDRIQLAPFTARFYGSMKT